MAQFGFRCFPINWDGSDGDEPIQVLGKKVSCPMPFSASWRFLGWNPGNDEEILHTRPADQFVLTGPHREIGSRFDYDKAKWYNQQYLIAMPNEDIAQLLVPLAKEMNIDADADKLGHAAAMIEERSIFFATYRATDTISLMNPMM